MKKIILLLTITFIVISCNIKKEIDLAEQKIAGQSMAKDILVLSADSLLGRGLFTVGEEKTLKYLQERMVEIGLQPAFGQSYLQEVPLVELTSHLPDKLIVNTVKVSVELNAGDDFKLWSPSLDENVSLINSDLVFAGYGIVSAEWNWKDFKNIDVAGKTVVVLVNDPGFYTKDTSLFTGRSMTYYGRWRYKFEEAERQGAAGCIIVHEDTAAGYPWEVVNVKTNKADYYLNDSSLHDPTCKIRGWITHNAAVKLFETCGYNYEEMKQMASKPDFRPVEMNARYSIAIKNTWKESSSYNVAGIIKGKKTPDEVIVYCAHWDHLGVGKPVNGDSIYNGASDNAAAIAWMFSIANAFKAVEKDLDRSVLFFSPTAEEAGMLGSEFYVNNPIFQMSKTIACINNDVVLFLGGFLDVTITGMGHSQLDVLLEEEAVKMGRYLCNDPNPENGMFYRSDHLPFVKAGVPSLFAKGYSYQAVIGREQTLNAVQEYWRNTYHKPADHFNPEVHKLDGLVSDSKLFFRLGYNLTTQALYPEWNAKSEFYVERF